MSDWDKLSAMAKHLRLNFTPEDLQVIHKLLENGVPAENIVQILEEVKEKIQSYNK